VKSLIAILAGLALSSGCVSNNPPRLNEFRDISNQVYILDVNDCSNKAGQYYRVLKKQGYSAKVIIIQEPDKLRPHAIVQISKDGKDYFADPTFVIYGTEPNEMYLTPIHLRDVTEKELEEDPEYQKFSNFK